MFHISTAGRRMLLPVLVVVLVGARPLAQS